MGINLRSCCHKCKERVFHYRGEESKTMMPFYCRHWKCMAENPDNVETREDQHQERNWMHSDEYTDWKTMVVGGIQVYLFDDTDYVAAASAKEAVEFYMEQCGWNIVDVAKASFKVVPLDTLYVEDMGLPKEEQKKITYEQGIKDAIKKNIKFPLFIASTEI